MKNIGLLVLAVFLSSCLGKTELGGTAKPAVDEKPETSKASTAKPFDVTGYYVPVTLDVTASEKACQPMAKWLKEVWTGLKPHQAAAIHCKNLKEMGISCAFLASEDVVGAGHVKADGKFGIDVKTETARHTLADHWLETILSFSEDDAAASLLSIGLISLAYRGVIPRTDKPENVSATLVLSMLREVGGAEIKCELKHTQQWKRIDKKTYRDLPTQPERIEAKEDPIDPLDVMDLEGETEADGKEKEESEGDKVGDDGALVGGGDTFGGGGAGDGEPGDGEEEADQLLCELLPTILSSDDGACQAKISENPEKYDYAFKKQYYDNLLWCTPNGDANTSYTCYLDPDEEVKLGDNINLNDQFNGELVNDSGSSSYSFTLFGGGSAAFGHFDIEDTNPSAEPCQNYKVEFSLSCEYVTPTTLEERLDNY